MGGGAGAQPAPHRRLFVSSPVVMALPPPPPQRHPRPCVSLRATRASRSSSGVLAGAGSSRCQPQPQTRLVAAQAQSLPPPLAGSAVRRDAETGLAFLLFVLAVVMSSFLLLAIFSFPARRALQQLETAAHKLLKVVAEEVPGTLSSLKLSFMEINDLTSQLKNLRQRLTIDRFAEKTNSEATSQSGRPKQGDV